MFLAVLSTLCSIAIFLLYLTAYLSVRLKNVIFNHLKQKFPVNIARDWQFSVLSQLISPSALKHETGSGPQETPALFCEIQLLELGIESQCNSWSIGMCSSWGVLLSRQTVTFFHSKVQVIFSWSSTLLLQYLRLKARDSTLCSEACLSWER